MIEIDKMTQREVHQATLKQAGMDHRFDTWTDYVFQIRDLCTALDLFNPVAFDDGHPVFDALIRTHAGMSKVDAHFVENVLGFYQERIAQQQQEAAP